MRLVIVGGSDAGISAGLRARELDPAVAVTLVLADRYPNFSICGIPYHVAGDVAGLAGVGAPRRRRAGGRRAGAPL